MDMAKIFHLFHNLAYGAIIITALYGIYSVIRLRQAIKRRAFQTEQEAAGFVETIRDYFSQRDFAGAAELCREPQHWFTGVAALAAVAIDRRKMPPGKLRSHLLGEFGRTILTDLETLLASVNMVVKCEPMLGLLGTVLGMIGAFTTIATIENPSPEKLMGDLSVALNCTALGLVSSIPLLMIANSMQGKIRRLEESTFGHLTEIVDALDEARDRAS